MECAEAEQAVAVAEFGPARAIANRNVTGGEIDDGRRNEERGDLARAALHQLDVLALDDVESADAGGDVNADFIEIGIVPASIRPFARQNPRRPGPAG